MYIKNFVYKSVTYVILYDNMREKKKGEKKRKIEGIIEYSTVSKQIVFYLFRCHNKRRQEND